jgi:hypothetical protein
MNNIAQKLRVETWETGPKLSVLEHNGAKAGNGSKAKLPPAHSTPRGRPEQNVLGWEIRMGRLVRGKSLNS